MTTQEKIKAIQTALGVKADGVFDGASVDAAYARLVPVAKAVPAAPKPAAPAPKPETPAAPMPESTPAAKPVLGGITADHWIEGAERDPSPGGKAMPVRRCVVMHFP